ncbi:MAG TPA: NADH-ubiquinone oxidoreductase-F iron-sulfur binding region domain-containing protein [Dissulfurispiraceae bacterium]|nr:NADH-ubiquinone oxidoreductase-F iron-sulfur binding region domain-containing protein [Dissulfurispiraceae bacterium]
MTTEKPLTRNIRPGGPPCNLQEYEKSGGYLGLRKALAGHHQDVVDMVVNANLLGRGGAGFPAGKKWSVVPMGASAPRPKYVVCNFDEMEPGSFKDRFLAEGDPHQLIEGMIIAGYAIEAQIGYIFIRKDYLKAERILRDAINEAYSKKYLGQDILGSGFNFELHLHGSAGRYICGESSALLNALEGGRAIPRSRPPHMSSVGLWGKPTVVNNVETICNVPHIAANGPEWFKGLSYTDEGGTKIYGASGRVRTLGAWELPMGTPLREILEDHAGGMQEGYEFRGVMPGGASSEFITTEHLDARMDFASMRTVDSHLGTGTLIVLDDRNCPIGMVLSLQRYFSRESCGWCTPCREGLPWIVQMLEALEEGRGTMEDIEILKSHTRLLETGNTFCTLAPAAMFSLESALRHFSEDFEEHVKKGRCPYKS